MVIGALLCLAGACRAVTSSAIATGAPVGEYGGAVRFSATVEPPAVAQVGIVQAAGRDVLVSEIMPDLARRARELGADYVKIDGVSSRFELETVSRMESYSCGTVQAPQTCTRTVSQTVEVMTTTINGRAFATRLLRARPVERATPPPAEPSVPTGYAEDPPATEATPAAQETGDPANEPSPEAPPITTEGGTIL